MEVSINIWSPETMVFPIFDYMQIHANINCMAMAMENVNQSENSFFKEMTPPKLASIY